MAWDLLWAWAGSAGRWAACSLGSRLGQRPAASHGAWPTAVRPKGPGRAHVLPALPTALTCPDAGQLPRWSPASPLSGPTPAAL